jgi:hypothetical protein
VPITVTERSKERSVFARLNTEIMGWNLIRGMDICVSSVFVLSGVGRADPPSKESYKLSIRFIISKFILNGNGPESLMHQGRRIRQLYCVLLGCRIISA